MRSARACEPPILGRSNTALDLAAGRSLWTLPVGGYLAGMPVLAGSMIYAATRRGTVLAIDAATGDPRWTVDVNETIDNRAELDDLSDEAVYEENCLVVLPGNGVLYVRTSTGVLALR